VITTRPKSVKSVESFRKFVEPHAEAVDSVASIAIHSSMDNHRSAGQLLLPQVLPRKFTRASGFGIPRAFDLFAREPVGDGDDRNHDGKRRKNATT
jgi:hypothetical protein